MEIWLKQDKDSIQIPILPASFSVGSSVGHQTVNIQTKGDVTILGKRGLDTIEFSSFFPAKDYPFAAYPKDRAPYEYVKKIKKWLEKAVRLTITGANVNAEYTIQSFSYGEPDGTGDIEYSISLQEYRKPTYTKPKKELPKKEPANKKPAKKPTVRPVQTPPKTHIVKSGDNLWNLAKKYYGDGSKETKLYNANKDVIENAARKHGYVSSSHRGVPGWWIFPGTKLVIPK